MAGEWCYLHAGSAEYKLEDIPAVPREDDRHPRPDDRPWSKACAGLIRDATGTKSGGDATGGIVRHGANGERSLIRPTGKRGTIHEERSRCRLCTNTERSRPAVTEADQNF